MGCALVALSPSSLAWSQAVPAQPRILSYPPTGVELGQGWNSQAVTKASSNCIVFAVGSSQPGQVVSEQKALVNDSSSLSSALNVSADAQVKWVSGSVDAKTQYAKSVKISSAYLNVVELVTVDNGWTFAAPAPASLQATVRTASAPTVPASVTPPTPQALQTGARYQAQLQGVNLQRTAPARAKALAQALHTLYQASPPPPAGAAAGTGASSLRLTDDMVQLAQTNPDQFRQQCGDGFVSAIQEGGELAATYTFETTSQSEQQKIGATLGVSYGTPVASGSASVSVADTLSNTKVNASTNISYWSSGGSGQPVPTTLAAIDVAIGNFASAVAQKPVRYQITVTDYRVLANFPSQALGMGDITPFQHLARQYARASSLFDDATQIANDLNDPTRVGQYLTGRWAYNATEVANIQGVARSRMDALKLVATNCLAASPAAAAAQCAVTAYDDLTPRTHFPLTIDQPPATLAAAWGSNAAFQQAVMNRWFVPSNQMRCALDADDCVLSGTIAQVQAGIQATWPATLTLASVDQPGQCLMPSAKPARGPYLYVLQPCPMTGGGLYSSMQYDLVNKGIWVQGPPNSSYGLGSFRPVDARSSQGFTLPAGTALAMPWQSGTGLVGAETSTHSQISAAPDGSGVYVVMADDTAQNNACLTADTLSAYGISGLSFKVGGKCLRFAPIQITSSPNQADAR